jgi:hypothetical protein
MAGKIRNFQTEVNDMSNRHRIPALAVVVALGAPTAAGAEDLSFSYFEGGFIAGFVNDVEESGAFTDNGTFELETDSGGGGFIGGAWQFSENMHLFGEYSSASQELEISDGIDTGEDDFDVVRWRIGVGYAYPLSPTASFYGRLGFDSIEINDVRVAGFDLDADVDDDGIGGEVGMIWAATPALNLQGHVRYTSVGEVVTEGADAFDSDTLVGLSGRWYFRPNIAVITGYEFGKITTWNLGVRLTF